jgi:hypothetical protein
MLEEIMVDANLKHLDGLRLTALLKLTSGKLM